MMPSLRRGGAAVLTTGTILASHLSCQDMVRANEVDHERIEIMRTDPVYRDAVSGSEREGSLLPQEGSHLGNMYSGFLDPWQGDPPPEDAASQLRRQVVTALEELREGGWVITGTVCHIEMTGEEATDGAPISYAWYAHGYRVHLDVPYMVMLDAIYPIDPDQRRTEIRVMMSAPLHADPDTDTYFHPGPPALPPGSNCIEDGEPSGPPTEPGTREVVTDGTPWQERWPLPLQVPYPDDRPAR